MGIFKKEKKEGSGYQDENRRKDLQQEIKIGIFLAICLAILAVFIFVVGDISTLFEKKGYTIFTRFSTVAGLEKRTVVRMAGVKVGMVKSISLKGSQAEVVLDIDPDIQIRRDSTATLASPGLLGEKYVEIVPGVEDDFVQPGGSIESISPVSFDELGILLASVGDDIKSTSQAVRGLLGEGEAPVNIQDILQDLSKGTMELNEFIRENRPLLAKSLEKSAHAIETFDQNVASISQNLNELIDRLEETVDELRPGLKGNLDGIKELISQTEEALKKLNESLEKINKGEGTLGKLIGDPSLYDKIEKTVEEAQNIVSPVSGFKLAMGLKAEYFARSERLKGTLSLGFWPAPDKFLLAQLVENPWKDKFTFSAQGGIRLGDFAPRAGIMESTFGVGLDFYTFKDRLIFTLEGFDFNRDPGPQFRAWTSFIASKYVHLLLGLNDFTFSEYREIYLGMRFGF